MFVGFAAKAFLAGLDADQTGGVSPLRFG